LIKRVIDYLKSENFNFTVDKTSHPKIYIFNCDEKGFATIMGKKFKGISERLNKTQWRIRV